MSDPADFIGRGIAFPFRVDQSGSIATSSGPADIDSSIRMILTTAPGERLMRPEFGCRIWELLFEPINANTLGLMGEAVREAIGALGATRHARRRSRPTRRVTTPARY